MKKHSSVLFVIALVAVVVFVFVTTYKHTPQVPLQNEVSIVTTSPVQEVQKENISEKGKGYTIDVEYPRTASASANRYMKEFVTKSITEFKTDTAWIADPSTPPSVEEASLAINYSVETNAHTISYIFSSSAYTGGAHGLTTTKTFVFDRVSAEYLTLQNIFVDEEKGLNTISRIATKQFTDEKVSDDEWIKEGAGPKEENYQSFSFDNEGMTIYFDPYQVAPYAYGPQTVKILYTALKEELLPTISQ